MTATQHNTQTLPAKPGVYIIRDATLPEYVLYVGIASDLKTRLSPSHNILEYCRNRAIEYTIDWELEPNEKKRKRREHQLISELDAKLNDEGISSESCQTEPEWQDDIDSLINQLEGEEPEPNLDPYEQDIENWKRRSLCEDWLQTAWANRKSFNVALTNLLYGRELKEFILEKFNNSDLFEHKDPRRVLLGSIGSPDNYFLFWLDKSPVAQGVGSSVILDSFHQAIYGHSFDLDFKGVEERFLNFLPYLHPSIAGQWEVFKRHAPSEKGFLSLRDIIQDFCDHALMWSQQHSNLGLFHPNISEELLVTKFFLENPYKQKCHVANTFEHYVSTADYVEAVDNLLKIYRPHLGLQYRVIEGYNSHRDYLSDSIELRLTT